MGATLSQVFPPAPDTHITAQIGRVFIVTGGYSGVGKALVAFLYGSGGIIYIAGRSRSKAEAAINEIRSDVVTTHSEYGRIEFLHLDLSDLATIRPAVEEFTSRESKLNVLVNNAGVNVTPITSRTAQDHELIIGTNCLGHLLLTLQLLPLMKASASSPEFPPSSTRVVWTSSQVVEFGPRGGITLSELDNPPTDWQPRYATSKTGNWFLASEFAKRYAKSAGILSLSQNPGALKTDILRYAPWWFPWLVSPLLYDAKYGAYTEFFCATNDKLTIENDSGGYVIPWGRIHTKDMRPDLLDALKSKDEGGSGEAETFWDWCEGHIKKFL